MCEKLSGSMDIFREIAGTAAAREMAEKISQSELYIYNGPGHAVYEEAKDFHERVFNFLMR